MTHQQAGPVLDALGVTLDLDEHQQVTEAMIIAKIVDFGTDSPGTYLVLSCSKGLDWIAQRGLMSTAQLMLDAPCGHDHDDDHDDGPDDGPGGD